MGEARPLKMMQRRCYRWGQTGLITVAGDDCIACLEDLGIHGKWAANIHDGSTPGGKAITRCVTPDPVTTTNMEGLSCNSSL